MKNVLLLLSIILLHGFIYSQSVSRDTKGSKDYVNVFYDPQYTLFDLWSDEPIFPDANGVYIIYYATNENKTPRQYSGGANDVATKLVYKFKNYENCKNWCDGVPFKPSVNSNSSAIKNSSSTSTNSTDINISDILAKRKTIFDDQKVDVEKCKQCIDVLYTAYIKKYKLEDSERIAFLKITKKCSEQHNRIPGFQKKLETLWNLRPDDPSKLSLKKINENSTNTKSELNQETPAPSPPSQSSKTTTYINNTPSNNTEFAKCISGNCDNGFGTMIFPANTGYKEYTGTWKKTYKDRNWNDVECQTLQCRFVKGKLVFTDGGYYEGDFDPDGGGYYQGYGVLFESNGNYKKGDFFKGVLNGNGEEKSSDGIVYQGRFINGNRQGVCTLTYPDGKQVKGRFWNGEFISDEQNSSTAKLDQAVTGLNPVNKTDYSTVNLGGKEWMSENLNSSKFRNGDVIPQAKTEQDLIDANANRTPVWCFYDFNPATETYYGKLYNWYAVIDPRGIMPIGYIIPSVSNWQSLSNLNLFKNANGRAQLEQSEGKEIGSGKINTRFFFLFENGPSKEKKYSKVFGVPESQLGFFWTTDTYKDQYNDRINVYVVGADGKTELDKYGRKGACVSVRGIKGDHNYYVGSWIGSSKSGNGTEFYGVPTELKGYGTVYKGDKYVGLWENGLQDGEGTIITTNGLKKTGLWKKGEFIGEWRLVDNRHKCYQCNVNYSKLVKRTDAEIANIKKTTSSNEIGIYSTESYCSATCEAKAEAESKARAEKYAREQQNRSSSSSNSGSTSSSSNTSSGANKTCSNCNKTFDKEYQDKRDPCAYYTRKETNPGYVICTNCRGLGYETTNVGCDCPNGVGWCYEKECYVGRCEGGWIPCDKCNGGYH